MSLKPHLLILSFTDARMDPREYRQALLLRDEYSITVAGFGDPGLDGVDFAAIEHRPASSPLGRIWRAGNLLLGNSGPFLQRFALKDPDKLHSRKFDAVIVHDAEPLPLGFCLAKGAPVIFDAHEYYPKAYEDLFWKIFHKPHLIRLCKNYMPKCANMITVCPGLATEYQKNFGILPEIVYSAPIYQDLPVSSVAPDCIRLIHHGGANPDRHIEAMLDMMKYVDDRFTLELMLVGDHGYIEHLRQYSSGNRKVIWKDPVPMPDLSKTINECDIGVYILGQSSFNNIHMLPNKFFEFIQARLGIVIGPSIEMAPIVKEHNLGVVVGDFTPQTMAYELNQLTPERIVCFKQNADKAAKLYNAEASMDTLKNVLRRALERNAR